MKLSIYEEKTIMKKIKGRLLTLAVMVMMLTALVLSGVTRREDIAKFPYRPRLVLHGVGDIPAAAEAQSELAFLEHAAG